MVTHGRFRSRIFIAAHHHPPSYAVLTSLPPSRWLPLLCSFSPYLRVFFPALRLVPYLDVVVLRVFFPLFISSFVLQLPRLCLSSCSWYFLSVFVLIIPVSHFSRISLHLSRLPIPLFTHIHRSCSFNTFIAFILALFSIFISHIFLPLRSYCVIIALYISICRLHLLRYPY